MVRRRLPLLIVLGAMVLASATPSAGRALAQTPAQGEVVYQSLMRATVWILVPQGKDVFTTGSGVLVDSDRRLVVTNYHVVGNAKQASVVFPVYAAGGRLVSERRPYVDQVRTGKALVGRVVAIKPQLDLALIELPRLPDTARALALGQQPVRPGQRVHAVGNPGASAGMWLYTEGKVRQAFFGELRAVSRPAADQPPGPELVIRANLIETTNPTNEGDSGGPLANDAGELVGITQGGARDARLLSFFIAVAEVRGLLASVGVRSPKAGTPSGAAAVTRPAVDAQGQERQARRAAADLQTQDAAKVAAALKVFTDGYALVYTDILADTLPKLEGETLVKGRAVLARRLAGVSTLAVQAYMQSPHAELRAAAAAAAALKRDRELVRDLIPLLDDKQEFIAEAALQSLRTLTGKDAARTAAAWRQLLYPPP